MSLSEQPAITPTDTAIEGSQTLERWELERAALTQFLQEQVRSEENQYSLLELDEYHNWIGRVIEADSLDILYQPHRTHFAEAGHENEEFTAARKALDQMRSTLDGQDMANASHHEIYEAYESFRKPQWVHCAEKVAWLRSEQPETARETEELAVEEELKTHIQRTLSLVSQPNISKITHLLLANVVLHEQLRRSADEWLQPLAFVDARALYPEETASLLKRVAPVVQSVCSDVVDLYKNHYGTWTKCDPTSVEVVQESYLRMLMHRLKKKW
jgi:hypothetical protein